MKGELKRILESAAEDMLRRYKNEILTTGILEAIGDKIRESLGQSKWVKWSLMAAQTFGFAAAALLVTHYKDLLPTSAVYALGVYLVCLFITLVVAFFSKAS